MYFFFFQNVIFLLPIIILVHFWCNWVNLILLRITERVIPISNQCVQWWKWKQRRNWFCLFLKNPCYDSKIMHVEFWLEVSKVLHLSINPVSWLFTMPELFLPEKAENSLNVKDYFFAKNDCRNIWEYSFASDMIELWLVIE